LGELRWGVGWACDKFFVVTDGQKRDYLSRASQRARGATKNGTRPSERTNLSHNPVDARSGECCRAGLAYNVAITCTSPSSSSSSLARWSSVCAPNVVQETRRETASHASWSHSHDDALLPMRGDWMLAFTQWSLGKIPRIDPAYDICNRSFGFFFCWSKAAPFLRERKVKGEELSVMRNVGGLS